MESHPINFLWLWPATDHKPHCRHEPINKIWRRAESTPRSGWWRSRMAGIYSDYSSREIINNAEHLTLESYTVFICQQSYLLLFGIPSPTHSFISGLKPSFSPNPSHGSPSFLLLKYLLRGFPGLFTVISEHICFLLFSVFTLFSCRFRAVD